MADRATHAEPTKRLTEAQKRWATEAPEWDAAKNCWVDAKGRKEAAGAREEVVEKTDAWVMVHHPELGLLLQAVTDDLEEPGKETREADPPKSAPNSAEFTALLQPSPKEDVFDYFWGNSKRAPRQPMPQATLTPAPPAEPPLFAEQADSAAQEARGYSQPTESACDRLLRAAAGDEEPAEAEEEAEAPEPPVRYRVVYKKVAVRQQPDTKSQALRQLPQGEIVDMFEWDPTHCWRRVRILAIREAQEGGGMQETDGWMLLCSPTVGTLLEEVEENAEGDDEDFAG
ncbi:unnamed protein product [Effrenium voratum]|nr:unnamed protein product [Effrenium voratum]